MSGRSAPRWNLSRCTRVTANVTVVNTNTAGMAMRAPDHRAARAAPTSSPTADQYEAPRNTAVAWHARPERQGNSGGVGQRSSVDVRPDKDVTLLVAPRRALEPV